MSLSDKRTARLAPALLAGFLLAGMFTPLQAQHLEKTFRLGSESRTPASSDGRPLSNSAVDFLINGDSVWVAGGKGLDLTRDGGRNWTHLGDISPFKQEDIAALDARGPFMCAALAGSVTISGTSLPEGKGLAFSTDNGATWTRIEQLRENESDSTFVVQYGVSRIKGLAVTTAINNITYDLAIQSGSIWTANFAAGLRRSTDGGKTFAPVVLPPDDRDSISMSDTLDFELSPVDRSDRWNIDGTRPGMRGNLNHRVFSVLALDDSSLMVGTAAGINYTTNNGASWRHFKYNNQVQPISGNFVVSLMRNVVGGVEHIWAATINATEPQEFRAVSYTTDRGKTWTNTLRGEFTHGFGNKGEIVYAATDNGVFRSDDGGRSWTQCMQFIDSATRQRAVGTTCYAAASQGDTIWVANGDALMKTVDNASSFFCSRWTIFRAAQGTDALPQVYAFPNPFSPNDEVCRVHYRTDNTGSVSITVYDFAMLPVRTLLRNAVRTPNAVHDEIWDGRRDDGSRAANAAYYIEVKAGDGDPAWTKVIVLQ